MYIVKKKDIFLIIFFSFYYLMALMRYFQHGIEKETKYI